MSLTRWDSFDARFWGRIDKGGDGGCWLWVGNLDAKGYGSKVRDKGKSTRPHRIAYELIVGPIPEGLVLDHLCRVRACCNPAHLEPVTSVENTHRGTDARWFEPCPNGHDPAHRKSMPSGKNVCTECRRISDAERHRRNGDARRAAGRARYARSKR